jgi:hypothetical protein
LYSTRTCTVHQYTYGLSTTVRIDRNPRRYRTYDVVVRVPVLRPRASLEVFIPISTSPAYLEIARTRSKQESAVVSLVDERRHVTARGTVEVILTLFSKINLRTCDTGLSPLFARNSPADAIVDNK